MDEVTKTRFKVLAGLAVIVVLVHLVLIKVFVFGGTKADSGNKKAPEKAKAPAVSAPA